MRADHVGVEPQADMPDQLFGQTSIPILLGEPNPVDEWQPVFVDKSQPVNDRAAYPPFAEVRANYVQLRESNLKLLQSLSEADLDNPPKRRRRGWSTSLIHTAGAS
jgi:hypothetical protein